MSFEENLNITIEQSFSIIPGWYETIAAKNEVPLEYIDVHHKHFFGHGKCKNNNKRNRKHKRDNTLNNLSECMWRYIENLDINRKPSKLLEVECICSSPLNARRNIDLICERVFEYVSVYRRIGCVNGVFEYKRVWEPRAVACVATTMPEPTRLRTMAYRISE
jgi:hypothetical protein